MPGFGAPGDMKTIFKTHKIVVVLNEKPAGIFYLMI